VVASLVLGLAISTRMWFGERQSRQHAVAAEAKAEAEKAAEVQLRKEAQAQELLARRTAYSADMNLVQQALAVNDLGRAVSLLNRHRPKPGQSDLRGWEWRYLWNQTRGDDHEVFLAGANDSPAFVGVNDNSYISISADGRLLLRGDGVQTVVTDLISRRTVLRLTNAWNPVFAHHSARLAFVDPTSANDVITLLDMAAKKERRFQTSWQNAEWLGFTPDDRRLLIVFSSEVENRTNGLPFSLTAWDTETGR